MYIYSMRKRRFLKAAKGFTLIELIAVIALMAIAATFTIPMIMRNAEDKQREIYYQGCVYVVGEAAALAETYNKIKRFNDSSLAPVTIGGYDLRNHTGVQGLLNAENEMAFRFNIIVTSSSINPNSTFTKDRVIVYFAYNAAKTRAVAVGAWYMQKDNNVPQIKYDYAKAAKIELSAAFTTPVFS